MTPSPTPSPTLTPTPSSSPSVPAATGAGTAVADPEGPTAAIADRVALGAVIVLPVLGALSMFTVPGWLAMFSVLWSPMILMLWVSGLMTFRRSLGAQSPVRAARGAVPWWLPALGWAWSVAMFLPGFIVLDGNDAEPWSSPLLRILGRDETSADWYRDVQGPVLMTAIAVAVIAPIIARLLTRRDEPDDATADVAQNLP